MHDAAILKLALPIYCNWINSFIPDEPECHYQLLDFTDDHPNGHYGYARFQVLIPNDYHMVNLYIFEVSIGDEGGPAMLYVWANDDDDTIVHMVQCFDTMLSNVARTDGMTNKLILLTEEAD